MNYLIKSTNLWPDNAFGKRVSYVLVLCTADDYAKMQAQIDDCISKLAMTLVKNLSECLKHMGYTQREALVMVDGK